jgi:hypothetical protein
MLEMSNNETQVFIAITLKAASELHIKPINIDILVLYFTKSNFKFILLPPYWSPHLSFSQFFTYQNLMWFNNNCGTLYCFMFLHPSKMININKTVFFLHTNFCSVCLLYTKFTVQLLLHIYPVWILAVWSPKSYNYHCDVNESSHYLSIF